MFRPCPAPGFALGCALLAAILLARAAPTIAQPAASVPERAALSEAARQAIEAPWLDEQERSALRIFHGVWDESDLRTPADRATAALQLWRLDDGVFDDPDVPADLRAKALTRRGMIGEAIDLLRDDPTPRAARLRAEALEKLGRFDEADAAVDRPVRRLLFERTEEASELTEGVRALIVRSRVRGQPARDFQTMLDLLGRAHQELDRLHWPATLAEAELLAEKDMVGEAVEALQEVLALNPRCGEAWYLLGRIAAGRFHFDAAEEAAAALRRMNPAHPLADRLLAEMRLIQDDPETALDLLEPLLERYPTMRRALQLHAAAQAILYDEEALHEALAHYDELSPGSARAHYAAGRHLALNRQYELAAAMLEEAIERQPAWPAPQIEQGLMELQSGRDAVARRILRRVVELDRFNKRAINSFNLLEEIADYARIETEHFIIRYRPGIDEVMAELMPERLEESHRTVTERFGFVPERKTVIELMPDHQRFAVRITGMPFVHTIAACTGPVIALEVPREAVRGRHSGLFDWPRVVQHEYTHTVTLAQTNNRIPHWLTEAAAVSMEEAPTPYTTCLMLAQSLEQGTLFDLDEIKWAFVRPRRPQDRGKAYAQGHWMLQYMNERFGDQAVIRLFEQYFDGRREREAMPAALGVSREEFFHGFLEWAEGQVEQWGLAAEPTLTELTDELRRSDERVAAQMAAAKQRRLDAIAGAIAEQIGEPRPPDSPDAGITARDWPPLQRPDVEITDEQLTAWLEQHPDHPDLVELRLRRRLSAGAVPPAPEGRGQGVGEPGERSNPGPPANALPEREGERPEHEIIELLTRYAELRPVDPFPHQRLAEMYLDSVDPARAIPHLEHLDAREERSPAYARSLARLYREVGDHESALARAERAVNINPYHAATRELAAAIAIEARQYDRARLHISALTRLEPDRPQHQQRLEAIERLIAGR